MKKNYLFFLFLGLLDIGLTSCSTTHKTVYVPVREKMVYVPSSKHVQQPIPNEENENWSVITDPVVLDESGKVVEQTVDTAVTSDYPAPVGSEEYTDFVLSEPPLPPDEPPPVRIVDYYYDSYYPDSYYPVSFTSYSYYPRRQATWWYYSDWNNQPFYYPSYPYYSNPWWSPYYGSSIIVRDHYAGADVFYSGYGYPGYGSYSFWSPLDYYNPYWSYGWDDYWGNYYSSPYLSHYGYYPYSHMGYPMYSWYDWRFHDWDDHYRWDRDREGGDGEEDEPKRESRPMFGDRRDQIRLTSSDSDGKPPIDGSTSLSGRMSRSPSKSDARDGRSTESERDPQQSISRQNQPLVGEWSLPPLRTPKTSNSTNPYYTHDNKNGQTIRTSREPKTSDNSSISSPVTQEPLRTTNSSGWTSDSPNSRVSIWRQGRVITPGAPSNTQRNTNTVPSTSTMSNRQIRILPSQTNRRNEPITSSVSESGNTAPTQTRSIRIQSPIRTLSPSNPVRQESVGESSRTFLSPSREPANQSSISSQPVSSPRTVSPSRNNLWRESYHQIYPAQETSGRSYSPRIQSDRSSYSPSRDRSPQMNSTPRTMSAPSRSTSSGDFGGGRSMPSSPSSSPSFSPSRSSSDPARSEAPSRPTSSRR